MAGYIGSRASVVSSGVERKKTFAITTTTTALTGLSYTPTFVHVFHNGVRLVDGTDYTATNGTSITLTTAAQSGDEVVVISYATFQVSDTVSASAGGTFAGDVSVTGAFTSKGIDDNAAATAITIDASGNVGIRTDLPSAALHVESGTADSLVAKFTGVNSTRGMSVSTYTADGFADAGVDLYGLRELRFSTNVSEAMHITSTGSVGIGTSSPAVRLENSNVANNTTKTTSTENNTRAGFLCSAKTPAGVEVQTWIRSEGDGSAGIIFTQSNHNLGFSTNNASPQMILDTSGNLLVGTTSQYGSQKLSLNGGIAIDGRSAATPGLSEKGDDNTGVFWPAADSLGFSTGGTERARIDSSGRVTMPYQPSFRAFRFVPISASAGVIVWEVSAHNIGNHYNTSNGTFTAPVNGTYHFAGNILMKADSSTSYIRVLFRINGSSSTDHTESLTGGDPGAFTGYSYHSIQIAQSFYLFAGDTVQMFNDNPNGSTYHSTGYGSFSGFLVG